MTAVAETDRLILREAIDTDFNNLFAMFNDNEVMKFYREHRDEAKTHQWIEVSKNNYRRVGHSKWIVELKATGEFLGYCGLLIYPILGKDEIELGYMLKRGAWGFGYATEAAKACLSLARNEFAYQRVVSVINSENLPARHVAERIGMSLESSFFEKPVTRVVYSVQF